MQGGDIILTPNQLSELPLDLYALTAELNDRIIEDIARRMAKVGRLTGTAEYELMRLNEIAAFDRDAQAYIAEYMEVSKREINTMLAEAAEMSVSNDIRISGVKAMPYKDNKYLQQMTAQIEKTTSGAFENLTDTLAFLDRSSGIGKPMPFRQTLSKALSDMELSVSAGLETYDTAIRRTVKKLSESGIIDKTLFYVNEKGTKVYRNLNTVVRQTMFGGLRLMTRGQAEYNAGLLKTDVYQITWHSGHRESHGWGGRRYSLSGSHGYPTPEQLYTQYGGGSLDDYGCRHDIIAVDPDAPPMYSDEELRQLEAQEKETKVFTSSQLDQYAEQGGVVRIRSKAYNERTQNGTALNRDDQEQRKREYERAIRNVRRDQTVVRDALDTALPEHKERISYEYYALKNKNNLLTKEYERFCDTMGFPAEKNRIYYDGRGRLGGAIPKNIPKILTNDEKYAINKYISAESYTINEKLRNALPLDNKDKKLVSDLDSALSKLPRYEGMLSRSVDLDGERLEKFLGEYFLGSEIKYPDYKSFTNGDIYNPSAKVQLYTQSVNGKDLTKFNQAEGEILYQRDSKFKVIDAKQINGVSHITLEEM